MTKLRVISPFSDKYNVTRKYDVGEEVEFDDKDRVADLLSRRLVEKICDDVDKRKDNPDVDKRKDNPDVDKRKDNPDVDKRKDNPDVDKRKDNPDVGKRKDNPDVGKRNTTGIGKRAVKK